ncbi:MAG: hypothetical protein II135_04430 [Clostridia bacterium]|nr:hypothetical protein [Clostridia bacterium]
MYKISVPVGCDTMIMHGAKETLEQVKRFDADRVFICLEYYITDPAERDKAIKYLKEFVPFFKKAGLEVGIWIWTFMFREDTEFECMTGIDGSRYTRYACPTDPDFVSFALGFIKELASCGPDLLMFDDDFRYGFFGKAPGCLCKNHVKMINGITGEDHTAEELYPLIRNGGKNKYRDAYLKANGDAFRSFAGKVRSAVDEVDGSIRFGFCTCMTGWDIDGVDAAEIARLLAGDHTKPFVRLIGAPYWASKQNWGNMIQDTIELERMEAAWTKYPDIEVMSEGDVFPRPRIQCPAAFLEGFDTALRAAGCTDGILKYGIDYHSRPDTETGYARLYERNKPIYEWIDRHFAGKSSLGVRVYSSMKKFGEAEYPSKFSASNDPEHLFFPMAARSLAYCSVPTVYGGAGTYGAVFDENARNLPVGALDNGTVIDIAAADILTKRGVDCGLRNVGGVEHTMIEKFADGDTIDVYNALIYEAKFDNKAEILSYAEVNGKTIPMSVFYENEAGMRFLILNVDPRQSDPAVMRHRKRSRQYAEFAERLGRKLPVYINDCPELYVQCKTDGKETVAGLWNFFADPVMDGVAELDREYENIEFFNCEGRLQGDKVYLSDIPPYGFAAFRIY